MAAKKTSKSKKIKNALNEIDIKFNIDTRENKIHCLCCCKNWGRNGSYYGCQVALLTIYDMCKAVDRGIIHCHN